MFDLGGRKVTVYCTPGHSLGEVVFIDDKSRILFSGDAANGNVGAVMTSVSTILRGLVKLQKLRPGYDRQYTGHISYAGAIDAVSQKPQVLDDVVEAFRSLLRGNAKTQVIQNHLFPERTQTVAVYGVARVGFNPERIWEPGGRTHRSLNPEESTPGRSESGRPGQCLQSLAAGNPRPVSPRTL